MLITESGMVTECKDLQPKNAPRPMLVTESGMVTDCKDLQPKNAPRPMLVTESGMVTDCKDEQLEYLQPIITQYFIDNKSEIWLLFLIAHSKR